MFVCFCDISSESGGACEIPALQVGLDQVRETDSLSLRSRVETLETNMEKEVPIFRGLGDQQDCKAVVECEAKDGLV